jgi:hypothetical protein
MTGTPEKPGKSAGMRSRSQDTTDSNAQIALKLRALYSSVEQQPLPDVFLDLLEKLDLAEKLGERKT